MTGNYPVSATMPMGKKTGLWKYYLRDGNLKAVTKFSKGEFTDFRSGVAKTGISSRLGHTEPMSTSRQTRSSHVDHIRK